MFSYMCCASFASSQEFSQVVRASDTIGTATLNGSLMNMITAICLDHLSLWKFNSWQGMTKPPCVHWRKNHCQFMNILTELWNAKLSSCSTLDMYCTRTIHSQFRQQRNTVVSTNNVFVGIVLMKHRIPHLLNMGIVQSRFGKLHMIPLNNQQITLISLIWTSLLQNGSIYEYLYIHKSTMTPLTSKHSWGYSLSVTIHIWSLVILGNQRLQAVVLSDGNATCLGVNHGEIMGVEWGKPLTGVYPE